MKKATLGLALVLLAGCAATTEDLAKSGDWYQIGYQDGIAGHTSRSVKELKRWALLILVIMTVAIWKVSLNIAIQTLLIKWVYLANIMRVSVRALSKRKNSVWNGNEAGTNTVINKYSN